MIAFMILSTLPLWFVDTPPLNDLIGHMGRYHVALEIDHNAVLARNWSYRWALIGNLGVDLLIMPLAWSIGLERAVWLVAALLPPLMIWGVFRAAKAVYGEVPPTAIATLPFALAYPYQYGFVNYWLAGALGFHAFAWWVRLQDRILFRSLLFVVIGFAVWLCHVYGWAILSLLVGGYELSRGVRGGERGKLTVLVNALLRSAPLMPVIVVLIAWRSGNQGAETLDWFSMSWKLETLFHTLQDQHKLLDIGSVAVAIFLIGFGMRSRYASVDGRFGIAAALFGGALLIIPGQLFGSTYADARIFPFLFIAAILSVRLPVESTGRSDAQFVALAFAALFTIRVIVSTVGYAEYDTAYKNHGRALDHVERGARIAVLVGIPCLPATWRLSRIEHLPSVALVRRDAFINTQWSIPGGQLLHPKHATGTTFNSDPNQFVADPDCTGDLRPQLENRIKQIPHGAFDYLWLLNFDGKSLPHRAGLVPVYQDDATVLYRLTDRAVSAAKR